ncbi:MAG: DHA2 family efflux MFS transporter permease subunit [Phyllobacterium sp.]
MTNKRPADWVETEKPVFTPQLWKITAVVTFGPFLSQLDTTLINIALPTLGSTFEAPLSTVQWVTTGYLLSLALMIPLCGWLVDRFGPKRVYVGSFTVFTLASAFCGLAQNIETLVAFRILQGMAGGLLAPMAQLMSARYAGPLIARMLALVGVPVLFAPIFGPFLGGSILHVLSWRGLFFANLPLGVMAIGLAVWLLPRDEESKPRLLDWQGFLLLSPGLVILLYSFERVAAKGERLVAVMGLLLGVVLLGSFVARSVSRKERGLIDLGLFRNRIFSTAAVTQFLANATTQGGQMLLSLYLLIVRGLSPAAAGLLLTALGVGLLLSRLVIDRLLEKIGPRALSACGAGACLVSTVPFLVPDDFLPTPVIVIALVLRGFGVGIVNMPSVVSAYTSIDRASLSDAATALNIAQRLGGPVATVALTLCVASHFVPGAEVAASATEWSFTIACGLLMAINVLCLASALRLPRRLKSFL